MLMALLKGKLSREQENMEDVLTSNVFGLMQYLPPGAGTLAFLREAVLQDGSRPLNDVDRSSEVEYEFWPKYKEADCASCEPDVLLHVCEPNGTRYLVMVEAKFHSGKSSEADDVQERPFDQLAREWDNLTHLAQSQDAVPLLVYLTKHFGFPGEDVEAGRNEYSDKRGRHAPFTCAWLSWRELPFLFRTTEDKILADLVRAVERLGLTYFRGFTPAAAPASLDWVFERPTTTFVWPDDPCQGTLWRSIQ